MRNYEDILKNLNCAKIVEKIFKVILVKVHMEMNIVLENGETIILSIKCQRIVAKMCFICEKKMCQTLVFS